MSTVRCASRKSAVDPTDTPRQRSYQLRVPCRISKAVRVVRESGERMAAGGRAPPIVALSRFLFFHCELFNGPAVNVLAPASLPHPFPLPPFLCSSADRLMTAFRLPVTRSLSLSLMLSGTLALSVSLVASPLDEQKDAAELCVVHVGSL